MPLGRAQSTDMTAVVLTPDTIYGHQPSADEIILAKMEYDSNGDLSFFKVAHFIGNADFGTEAETGLNESIQHVLMKRLEPTTPPKTEISSDIVFKQLIEEANTLNEKTLNIINHFYGKAEGYPEPGKEVYFIKLREEIKTFDDLNFKATTFLKICYKTRQWSTHEWKCEVHPSTAFSIAIEQRRTAHRPILSHLNLMFSELAPDFQYQPFGGPRLEELATFSDEEQNDLFSSLFEHIRKQLVISQFPVAPTPYRITKSIRQLHPLYCLKIESLFVVPRPTVPSSLSFPLSLEEKYILFTEWIMEEIRLNYTLSLQQFAHRLFTQQQTLSNFMQSELSQEVTEETYPSPINPNFVYGIRPIFIPGILAKIFPELNQHEPENFASKVYGFVVVLLNVPNYETMQKYFASPKIWNPYVRFIEIDETVHDDLLLDTDEMEPLQDDQQNATSENVPLIGYDGIPIATEFQNKINSDYKKFKIEYCYEIY